MSGLDVHVQGVVEVLLNNGDTVERNLVSPLLDLCSTPRPARPGSRR